MIKVLPYMRQKTNHEITLEPYSYIKVLSPLIEGRSQPINFSDISSDDESDTGRPDQGIILDVKVRPGPSNYIEVLPNVGDNPFL